MDDEFEYSVDPVITKRDRRSFLSAALVTVTAAAVTGGAAALLLEDDAPPPAIVAGTAPPLPPAATLASDPDSSALRTRLTALEAENSSLQANLAAAQRQLASYSGLETASAAGDEDWRQQFEQASAQASGLAGQLATVRGLLALYEELEAVDLAAVTSGGMAAFGGAIGDLMADIPSVSEGLQTGRKALDEFEAQLPLIEQGRYWLEGQMAIVRAALEAAETALNGAVNAGGTLLQLLNRWFEDILEWLPFGIGKGALAIMSAVSAVLGEVPETLDGLQANVAGPLDEWLARDGDEIRLQRRLIKPVREDVLARAGSTVERVGSVNEVYEAQLREPIAVVVERQRLIREQIVEYRQSHSV
jgi:hypothetical protein